MHEYTAERYVELGSLPHAIPRLSNVRGACQRSDLEGVVVSIFTDRLLARQPADVVGGRRAGSGLRLRLERRRGDPGDAGVSQERRLERRTGVPTTDDELLRAVAWYSGAPVEVRYLPPRHGEILLWDLDVSRSVATGIWRLRDSLSEGLHEAVEQIRQR